MHRFQEESFFYHTLFDFKDIVDQFGDRVWEELELHCPALYESFCAYKANKDVNEFLITENERKWQDACDYWKEEDECND